MRSKLGRAARLVAAAAFIMLPWQTIWLIEPARYHIVPLGIYLSEIMIFAAAVMMFAAGGIRIHRRPHAAAAALIALAIGISIYQAEYPLYAVQAYAWWGAAALYALMMVRERTHLYRNLLALSLSAMALVGIVQFITQSIPASTILGISAQHPEYRGVPVVMDNGNRILRAFGSMPHPNIYGGYMVLMVLMAGVLHTARKTRPYAPIVFTLGLIGVLVSFSRSAWAMALIVGIILWARAPTNHFMKRMMNVITLVVTLFVVTNYAALAGRIMPENAVERRSIDERTEYFKQASELLKNNAWWGMGIHQYAPRIGLTLKPEYPLAPVHNTPLLILIEMGAVALTLLAAAAVRLRASIPWRAMSTALIMLTPALLVDHYLWSLYAGMVMSSLTLAMSIMLNTKSDHHT